MAIVGRKLQDSDINIQLSVTNWPDMDEKETSFSRVYTQLVQTAIQQGIDVDALHLHAGEDIPILLKANQSLMEDRFYRVYNYSA